MLEKFLKKYQENVWRKADEKAKNSKEMLEKMLKNVWKCVPKKGRKIPNNV